MNYGLKFITIICLLTLLLYSSYGYAQESNTNAKNLSIVIHYPIPNSKETFKEVWEGIFSVAVTYQNLICRNLFWGGSFNYSYFQIDKSKLGFELNTKMHILSPSVIVGYKVHSIKTIHIEPKLGMGYSWILYRNKDFPEKAKRFDESGFHIEPLIAIQFSINDQVSLGVQSSYKIIFEHFGDYRTPEDSTIRYLNLGIGLHYNF